MDYHRAQPGPLHFSVDLSPGPMLVRRNLTSRAGSWTEQRDHRAEDVLERRVVQPTYRPHHERRVGREHPLHREDLFEPGPESDLYKEIRRTEGQQLESRIGPLRPKVDLFFDKVLVNAPDPNIRRNRLALLHSLLQEFSTIADFSEIVTER